MKTFFKQISIAAISIILAITSFAQSPTLEPDEIYPVIPLPKIRAQDVMWHRRIWREIDLTEKVNQHLYFYHDNIYPTLSFYDILLYYVNKELLTPYSPINDRFTDTYLLIP